MKHNAQGTFAALAAFDSPHHGFVVRLIDALGVKGAEKYARERHLDGLVREIRLAAKGTSQNSLGAC